MNDEELKFQLKDLLNKKKNLKKQIEEYDTEIIFIKIELEKRKEKFDKKTQTDRDRERTVR